MMSNLKELIFFQRHKGNNVAHFYFTFVPIPLISRK